jgi:hypothetical protein
MFEKNDNFVSLLGAISRYPLQSFLFFVTINAVQIRTVKNKKGFPLLSGLEKDFETLRF